MINKTLNLIFAAAVDSSWFLLLFDWARRSFWRRVSIGWMWWARCFALWGSALHWPWIRHCMKQNRSLEKVQCHWCARIIIYNNFKMLSPSYLWIGWQSPFLQLHLILSSPPLLLNCHTQRRFTYNLWKISTDQNVQNYASHGFQGECVLKNASFPHCFKIFLEFLFCHLSKDLNAGPFSSQRVVMCIVDSVRNPTLDTGCLLISMEK